MPRLASHLKSVNEAMSIAYNNRVYELKRRGAKIIVLSLGEAFFDIPLRRFDDLPFPDIYHYSHSRGLPQLREKLSSYYMSQHGVTVDAEKEILITSGSKAAIFMTFASILDPGDEVLIHEPAWVSYTEQIKLCHGVPISVPYNSSIKELEDFITPRTKAIVVNYPHNPRGQTLSSTEAATLHAIAKKHDLFLLADEAYSDFVTEQEKFYSLGIGDPQKEHTIIFNSMSKNYGMSGWRIGYVIANPEFTYEILKVNQHLITCPATILQWYLYKHFDSIIEITKPQIQAVVEKRNSLAHYMKEISLDYLDGSSTFYFFVSLGKSKLDSQEFATNLLENSHVCVVPGIGYGQSCDRFVRVSVGTETLEDTKEGLLRIKQLIDKTS